MKLTNIKEKNSTFIISYQTKKNRRINLFKPNVFNVIYFICPPLHLGVVAIEKGAFGSPSTMVANLFHFSIYKVAKSIYSGLEST